MLSSWTRQRRSNGYRSPGARRMVPLAVLVAITTALTLTHNAAAAPTLQATFPVRVDPGEGVMLSNGAIVFNAAAKPVVVDLSVELQLGQLVTFDSFNFAVEGSACRARTVQMSCIAPPGVQLVIVEASGPGRSPDRTITPGSTLALEYDRTITNEQAVAITVFDYPDVYDWTAERWVGQMVIIAPGATPRVSGGANCRPLPPLYFGDWDCIMPLGSAVVLAAN